jgi:hypothetical protein
MAFRFNLLALGISIRIFMSMEEFDVGSAATPVTTKSPISSPLIKVRILPRGFSPPKYFRAYSSERMTAFSWANTDSALPLVMGKENT